MKPKVDNPCKGCVHWRGRYWGSQSCNYIFDTGHSRPCPPGAECTVKETEDARKEKPKE